MTVISVKDLVLRPIEIEDAQRFAELVNDYSLAKFTSRVPYPYTLDDAEAFVRLATDEEQKGDEHRFAACRNSEIIACVGLRRSSKQGVYELGYWVGADYRGAGVATNIARAVVYFGFEILNAQKIAAGHFVDNPASGRVLRKIGFRPTGETLLTCSLARAAHIATPRFEMEQKMQRLTDNIAIAPSQDYAMSSPQPGNRYDNDCRISGAEN
ncbi:MAG: GNAT family N-acetyltransferase [Pseudomonadota bacterium]